MAGPADTATWKQLGEALEHQRVSLGVRYANLTLFTQERGIDYRLCWDIEHGARTNYRRTTRTAIEVAYGLPQGYIDKFLGTPALSTVPDLPDDDAVDAAVEVLSRARGLSDEERETIRRYGAKARGEQPGGGAVSNGLA